MTTLGMDGPLSYGAVAVFPDSPSLRQALNRVDRFGEPYALWTTAGQEPGTIGVPRGLCAPGGTITLSDGEPIALTATMKPRDKQQARLMDETVELLQAGESFILEAPTGTGKTVIGLYAIASIGKTALVVVPKEDLIDQWVARAVEHLGMHPDAIGRLQGDRCDVAGRAIVIGSLQSIAKPGRYPPWVYRHFGLVVFDEVHRLGAELFSNATAFFHARLRLGLSATPERSDGREELFEAHIGPVRVRGQASQLTPRVLVYETGWSAPRDRNGRLIPHSPGRIALIMPSLINHSGRNRIIAETVSVAYRKGRHTVIFSDYTEHLAYIRDLLLPRAGVPLAAIGSYYGTLKGAALAKQGTKPVVVATYAKMAEGTDIPRLDTCVFASPKSRITQPLGRILRPHPNKVLPPVAIDLVDSGSKVLRGYAHNRRRYYRQAGADVHDMMLEEEA